MKDTTASSGLGRHPVEERLGSGTLPDEDVIAALRLGWNMAIAYQNPPPMSPTTASSSHPGDHLPGFSSFTAAEVAAVRRGKIEGDVKRLGLGDALQSLFESWDTASSDQYKQALIELFVKQHIKLAGLDSRLVTALGLGRMLADTVYLPTSQNPEQLATSFEENRIDTGQRWLEELRRQLPAGAAAAVIGSLDQWQKRASQIDAEQVTEALTRRLRKQGELWRRLLCGETAVADQLTGSDYVRASAALAQRFGATAIEYSKHWYALILLMLPAVALFIWAILQTGIPAETRLLSVVAALLGTLGISWKTIGGSLGRIFAAIEQPLWEAAVSEAAVHACTLPMPSEIQNDSAFRDVRNRRGRQA
ncbi:hypothetical protein [Sinomonas sp. P47F7]|uniref:hypothetical protein n=1 Tax=Sinomonas sp. P47F7 TaxID=3410987 RepID=UPI003BF5051F